ncbi:MAG TPA: glycogen/starch/alpha-glucan phosphorylase [Blastocatellia bacterium]|nr:glycogen/starch/alpha-glucan phosphorylase [Blastocatellia bacterium]
MMHDRGRNMVDGAPGLQESIRQYVRYTLGKTGNNLSKTDLFLAVAQAVRQPIIDRLLETEDSYQQIDAKRLYYLSMEFLIGRFLVNNLINIGLYEYASETLLKLGIDLEELRECERDAALGSGGLGRLAACFLDSLATQGLPGFGYGIRYEYGLFKQEIENGHQKEHPDNWLESGYPWEIKRSDETVTIPVYGRMIDGRDSDGNLRPQWVDAKLLVGVPYDVPIVGYDGRSVNYLRLYSSRSSSEFDLQVFNQGDHLKAMEQKMASEIIIKVLYPSDAVDFGRELRLLQEYFFVACAVRDITKRYLKAHQNFDAFPDKVAIQLNDTHPALTVAELMRYFVDEQKMPWEQAWNLTRPTLAYTNHTLLPEALEKWPVSLLQYVLPRHLQIIYEINQRFLNEVITVWPGDDARVSRMSIIEENGSKQVRMANLAIIGSHSVNGVAELHTELLKTSLVPDFYQLWPSKFNNKTNGVTQRRWLLKANPKLARLITGKIGDEWITDLSKLKGLEPYAEDASFQDEFLRVKRGNKERLARVIKDNTGVIVDPDSLFDVQIKRMHEYKRQLLNVMHIVHEYHAIIDDNKRPLAPRTYVFSGKAAPSYWAAKQIIKLINNVGEVINNDPRVEGAMKIVFLPDYRVSLAERIIPAADLSEQISTAGTEASGTGNMKLAMNGALTVGTLDGANIEILQEVGAENIFIFGCTAEQIQEMRDNGTYHPADLCEQYPNLKRIMETFTSDLFSRGEPGLFGWIYRDIMVRGDRYFHLADMESYLETQEKAAQEFLNKAVWARKAILNVARIGKFSSDRSIYEYNRDVWHLQAI